MEFSILFLKFMFLSTLTFSLLNSQVFAYTGFMEIPALGRVTDIGSLYDSHSHNFLPNSIFKSLKSSKNLEILEAAIQTVELKDQLALSSTNFINCTQDKFELANIPYPLSLAILSELISPETEMSENGELGFLQGTACNSIFNENPQKLRTAGAIQTGVVITQNIKARKLLNIFAPNLHSIFNDLQESPALATHSVVGINYGKKSFKALSDTSCDFTERGPISYILLPIPTLKSYIHLTKISNYNHNSTANIKLPNAPFTFMEKNVASKFFQVFDAIYDVQRTVTETQTYIESTTVDADFVPNENNQGEMLQRLMILQERFEDRLSEFKNGLGKSLKIASKNAEDCKDGSDKELVKILEEYKDGDYSPSKVKEAGSEILFEFQQLVILGLERKITVLQNRSQCDDFRSKWDECETKLKQVEDELRICREGEPQKPKLPHPGSNVPNITDEDIDLLQGQAYCKDYLDCVQGGNLNYPVKVSQSNLLFVAVNQGLSYNITQIERLVCMYNINTIKKASSFDSITRARVVKYIVENLAGCNRSPNAVMYTQRWFQGEEEVYDYNLTGNRTNVGCMNLNLVAGRLESFESKSTCVRLYTKLDCKGDNRMFAGNRVSWPDNNFFADVRSIASCFYDFDRSDPNFRVQITSTSGY